jgi:hypothetical protein
MDRAACSGAAGRFFFEELSVVLRRKTFRLRVEALETRLVPALPSAAPSLGPPPAAGPGVVYVQTVADLQNAVSNATSNETIVLEPGTYTLSSPLILGPDSTGTQLTNITIRGATDNYDDVVVQGAGMDNPSIGYGFYLRNVQNVTLADLSVRDVYYHPVFLDATSGCNAITIYHDHIYDGGEQLIKSVPNSSGGGVNNTTVQYCTLEYTNGVSTIDHGGGTGYTNGIDVHAGTGWVIADNLIQNIYTPDNAQNLWDPAVLIWNHSSNCTTERNTFINDDRAIAYGLVDQSSGDDNTGGTIVNNFVYMTPGLFSASRSAAADGQIIVWDSPNTTVYQNTVITSGNCPKSVEFRFTAQGVAAENNLTDAPITDRDGQSFTASGNYTAATPDMFVNPSAGDLHLVSNSNTQAHVLGQATAVAGGVVTDDFDKAARPTSGPVDIGADQYSAATTNQPPTVATPASASPSPVTGTTTALSVLGADDGGESNLTYTWSSSGPAAVTYSANGTNAAKNATATFTQAGSYSFTVTIKDSGGLTATSSVTVTVNQTLTTVTVSPGSATVAPGATQQFTATQKDQFGLALTSPLTVTWSVSGGGTIATTGLFTAGSATGGPWTVTAAAGGLSGTASVTVASSGTNLASSGTAYRWYGLKAATGNSNKTKASGLNDGNLTTNVVLTGGGADSSKAYEAAGVIWSSSQSLATVTFTNGSYTSSDDGVFDDNFTLQFTTDGKTWKNASSWSLTPAYAYNSAAAANVTYTFTGPATSALGFRMVGQVHTAETGVNSWYDQATEVQAFGPTASAPAGPGANVAAAGTAFQWSGLATGTSNANRTAAPGLNDGNLVGNVDLSGKAGDLSNAFEAAGILWSTPQAVSQVVFVNGSYTAGQDGVFDAGFQLQFTTDGTTWTNAAGWAVSSPYAYNSSRAAGVRYLITGPATSALGFRVVGQVHTAETGVNSWYDQATEVQAFGPA